MQIWKSAPSVLFALYAATSWADTCTVAPGVKCPNSATLLHPLQSTVRVSPLAAPTACSPVGSWISSGGRGAPAVIQQNFTGTYSPTYCPAPIVLSVTLDAGTMSVVGTWSGTDVCQSFTEQLTFSADCSTASGQYVNADGRGGPDVWVRQNGGLTIIKPIDQSEFQLLTANLTATQPVAFQGDPGAANPAATVSWTTLLEYETTLHKGRYAISEDFTTTGTGSTQNTYSSIGGKLTVNATAGSDSANAHTIYITGTAIPETDITSRLLSLYSGPTPNLMTGIAEKESNYMQFRTLDLYQHTALWPNESRQDGGSHVGLMQMPTSESKAYAWDWTANTQAAVTLYANKVAVALRLEKRIIQTHPGLRALTDVERENMALTLYGDHASGLLSQQYYTPIRTRSGRWDWKVNTAGNPGGVAYADDVRAQCAVRGNPC